jgi:hypothetical protein
LNDCQKRWGLLLFCLVIVALFFFLVPPLSQDQTYHNFADNSVLLGLPNGLNVLSNVLLLAAGLAGLALLGRGMLIHDNPRGYPSYLIFFAGLTLTGIGSAYYHWSPGNGALLWDRMGMAVSFSALTVALVSEHGQPGMEKILLYPLLGYGLFSVLYWYFTEQNGRGDLRFYAVEQFLPLLIILVLCFFFESRFTRSRDIMVALVLYGLGKVAEHFDHATLSLSGFISGHTMKHVFVGAATFWVLRMLLLRRRKHSIG